MSGLIKICGLTRAEDAAFCAKAGADWLGFIFHPQSPRAVSPEMAAGFETGPAKRVGVFVNQKPDEILKIMAAARLDLAQLHGGQKADFIRAVGPEKVIMVHWPANFQTPALLAEAVENTKDAAWHLFDAGKSGGGHGQKLDLDFIRRAQITRPWLLAGGLDGAAVGRLDLSGLNGLAGFDFNSALEDAPGQKNKKMVLEAVAAVKRNGTSKNQVRCHQ
ncbi:phosphoribosylanthranilate isomerase [Deltaproteobacteria bacterium OttesenSCG-928-K17]|nr:phosphoribosylanthranilate isomerase [Deltaproteobacteria bacterium OttesenSCG-928-K17]